MKTLEWRENCLIILDQTCLPTEIKYREACTYQEVAEAIKKMEVRGAPAIGAAASFGFALGALAFKGNCLDFWDYMETVRAELEETRPTAVNLVWGLRRMQNRMYEMKKEWDIDKIKEALVEEAKAIAVEDVRINRKIGEYGNTLLPDKVNILTHCNAGSLATVDYGTALGIVRSAHDSGKNLHVYAGETRPFLQGARLTVLELMEYGIPVTLITDNMAGFLMQQGKIDMVIVGADRIAANGDTANKIGTYSLAVLAEEHEIPFYVAAPTSSIDLKISSGEEIPVEERDPCEVRTIMGVQIAPETAKVYNPAFDITPAKYIHGIITEKGIIHPPYSVNLVKILVK
ncbi:methylthioribose-1-phosphate isomerase [Syntrophobotulus glycolicus DSM 8271]|uniref:Methylthioribose-1-phosphate isomerase n=1 Tax=Syntrophobotulus glycolicus (strain DSM 8271 / FlGlyR) TaxID=645991 RepID=F0SUE7_SYNGF|nr:S-methyl-5-thioribose-1-phosphate isomerase [Syntrophobotulus glycolicus]ADY56597.1 methylthioribose-1-phosphate isomerase [Syntrophobotulus glycolicus DSM 8271]